MGVNQYTSSAIISNIHCTLHLSSIFNQNDFVVKIIFLLYEFTILNNKEFFVKKIVHKILKNRLIKYHEKKQRRQRFE